MARQWAVKQGRDLYGGLVAADPAGIQCGMVWCGMVRMIQLAHVVWCAKPCGMYCMVCMIMWHGGMVCVIQQADGKRLISIVSTTTCPATATATAQHQCVTHCRHCNCSEHCTKQSSVDQVHILDQELTSPTSEQLYNLNSTVQG